MAVSNLSRFRLPYAILFDGIISSATKEQFLLFEKCLCVLLRSITSILLSEMEFTMSRNNRNRRIFTRNEKIFYVLSLLIVVSMVLGTVAVALGPTY